MSCNKCIDEVCQCSRVNAINRFSSDYRAGLTQGRADEATRTTDALIELEQKGVISNAQMQAILDLILEKLGEQLDID